MIKEVDDALIEALKKGLSDLAESIVLGEVDTKGSNCVALENADFTIQETGIGGSLGDQMEEVSEKIEPDGSSNVFNLSGNPLSSIISVESPIGTIIDPDNYRIDYEKNQIHFYVPPPKEEPILVRYRVARSIGEIQTLKFDLTYYLTIWAKDPSKRDEITIEAIKTLYRQITDLRMQGIDEIELIKGQLVDLLGDQNQKARRIEYLVKADIAIERPLLPIKKIEVKDIRD